MKGMNTHCDPDLAGRYFDGELSSEEKARFEEHLETCPSCETSLRGLRTLSDRFRIEMERAVARADFAAMENRFMKEIHPRRRSWPASLKALLWSPKVLAPAAAVAVALALFFRIFSPSLPAVGPSAIINSFTGEVSSVIIIETPESRHTIVWYTEPPGQEGTTNGSQETSIHPGMGSYPVRSGISRLG